jgi:hypothetical protein
MLKSDFTPEQRQLHNTARRFEREEIMPAVR